MRQIRWWPGQYWNTYYDWAFMCYMDIHGFGCYVYDHEGD